MRTNHHFNAIRYGLRTGNDNSLTHNIAVLSKKAADKTFPDLLRLEMNLEIAKAMRAIGQFSDAGELCDRSMAVIPSGSGDLLSSLKRVRVLSYLDAGDIVSARNLVEEIDGLELVLDKNQKQIDRKDTDVTVETWLVSIEVALASGDLAAAEDYFSKAVDRLAVEEEPFRKRKVINPIDRKNLEQYFGDLRQMLTFYGCVVGMVGGSEDARRELLELKENVLRENRVAVTEQKAPNVVFLSKIECVLGEWLHRAEKPAGLSFEEASRWLRYADLVVERGPADGAAALASLPVFPTSRSGSNESLVPAVLHGGTAGVETDSSFNRMAEIFENLEKFLPGIMKLVGRGDDGETYQRGFTAHLLDVDLHSFLHNIKILKLTGYVVFSWKKDLYETAILKGLLSDKVRTGKAYLYAFEGVIIDATFEGDTPPFTLEVAQENFVLLTRMCLSMEVDNIEPVIIGETRWSPAVAERPRLLKITDNQLLFIASDIENALAGVSDVGADSPVEKEADKVFAEGEKESRLKIPAGVEEEELLEIV